MFPKLISCMFSVCFFISMAGCGVPVDSPAVAVEDHKKVLVGACKTKTLTEFSYPINFYGRVQATRSTTLGFEVPGQILEIHIDEGEEIKAGEELASLNKSILVAEREKVLATKRVEQAILRKLATGERNEVISAARAIVTRMAAELEQSERETARLERLHVRQAISESEYEDSIYRTKSLEASLEGARARLTELVTGNREEDIDAQTNRIGELDAQIAVVDARIKKTVLLAPFDATVIERHADEGAVVSEGQTVLTISEVGSSEARFSVPVEQLQQAINVKEVFVEDHPVAVKTIRQIPNVAADTRTVDIVFRLESHPSLIEGRSCQIHLDRTVEVECVKIPVSALVPSVRGLWSCYQLRKIGDEHEVIRHELTVNHTDGENVYVETSLPDGSLLVCEGVHKIVPGMIVRVGMVQ